MADVERLKQMAEEARQRARERQEAEDKRSAENFQAWTETVLSQAMREALQLTPGWDQRQQFPMATFELGRERGRLYRGNDQSDELVTVIVTDSDGRETLSASVHSEDELLLLIEKYL